MPYIAHPFGVMCIASQVTVDEDILIACLFHDVLEDVPEEYSRQEMLADFGEKVVAIVEGVTKNENLPDWQTRQEAYLHHLEYAASDDSVIVSCSDKIHNLMTILRDYDEVGDKLWERFNAGKASQQWWYRSVLEVTNRRLPELELNKQLHELVQRLDTL